MADSLDKFSSAKGFTEEEKARLKLYADQVAQVESLGKPDAVQGGGGPGRGKYQYELASGSGRNKTGKQRLKNFEKKYGDLTLDAHDRNVLNQDDPDYSQMTEGGQDEVFFADLAMGPVNTRELARGEATPEDTWIKHHWAGAEDQAPQKREQWRRTQAYRQQMMAQAMRGVK